MLNLSALILFALLAIERNGVASYKILGISPVAGPSHYFVVSALMKGLAADGHEVTFISPFKQKAPIPNYNEVYLDGVYDSLLKGNFDLAFDENLPRRKNNRVRVFLLLFFFLVTEILQIPIS